MTEPSLVQKTWSHISADEFFEIAALRTSVFFLEQRIDEEELDDRDREETTEHLWIAEPGGAVLSYLRVVVDAEPQPGNGGARRLIGRVVTRADARGRGLSSRLLDQVITRHGHEPLALHAQSYIQPLYARHGFVAYGEEYLEAGIPHVSMLRAPSA